MPLTEVQNTVGDGTLQAPEPKQHGSKRTTAGRQTGKPTVTPGAKAFHITAPKLKAVKAPASHSENSAATLAAKPSLHAAQTSATEAHSQSGDAAEATPSKRPRPLKAPAGAAAGRRAKAQDQPNGPAAPAPAERRAAPSGSSKAKPKGGVPHEQHPHTTAADPSHPAAPSKETQAQKAARLTRGEPATGIRGTSAPQSPAAPPAAGAAQSAVTQSAVKAGRRRRAQPARYGEWVQVQDTPRPEACSAGREQQEGVEEDVDGICKAGERLDKESPQNSKAAAATGLSSDLGGAWKLRTEAVQEFDEIMQKMADLADTLPAEGPAAGGKGRGRQAKEVPLRQRLVESWEGKTYYERLAVMAEESSSPEEANNRNDETPAEDAVVDNVTSALLRMDLKPKDKRKSVAAALSAVHHQETNRSEAPIPESKGSAVVTKKAPAAAAPAGGASAAAKARKAPAPKPRAVRKAGKAAAEPPGKAKAVAWAGEKEEEAKEKEEREVQQCEAVASQDPSGPPQETLKHTQQEVEPQPSWLSPEIGSHPPASTPSAAAIEALAAQFEDASRQKSLLQEENARLRRELEESARELEEARSGRGEMEQQLREEREAHKSLQEEMARFKSEDVGSLCTDAAALQSSLAQLASVTAAMVETAARLSQ